MKIQILYKAYNTGWFQLNIQHSNRAKLPNPPLHKKKNPTTQASPPSTHPMPAHVSPHLHHISSSPSPSLNTVSRSLLPNPLSPIHEWLMSNADASPREQRRRQPPRREDRQDRARCEWSFSLAAAVSPRTREVSDVLGAVELEPSGRLLATGGISRKIRVYNLQSLLNRQGATSEDFYICTPAKLSSLRWRPDSGTSPTVAAGDYDGVVTEYDVGRRIPVSERDEHGGRRVWCVDYSAAGDLAASASDDGTAHIWDPRCPGGGPSVSVISSRSAPGAPVCSVEFDKSGKIQVGVACADKCAYIYDLRNMKQPALIFSGHQKTVTYVRFACNGRVVTSSVDGCHRMWNVTNGEEVRAYRGHRNARSFVGMDVCNGGGLIGSGSESNEVFVYDLRWGDPIWVQDFGEEDEGEFVSAVCWREIGENECALVAGGSNGVVKVFDGSRVV